MGMFECCHGCVAPKRYPGCHDHCPHYQMAKAKNDERKANQFKRSEVECGIMHQKQRNVSKAMKNCRKGTKYAQ